MPSDTDDEAVVPQTAAAAAADGGGKSEVVLIQDQLELPPESTSTAPKGLENPEVRPTPLLPMYALPM